VVVQCDWEVNRLNVLKSSNGGDDGNTWSVNDILPGVNVGVSSRWESRLRRVHGGNLRVCVLAWDVDPRRRRLGDSG
jgi:hypothetical protein